MDEYREWTVPGPVTCAWSRGTARRRTVRIVPDGCVDLMWTGRELVVAGPDTGPVLSDTQPGELVGVRFGPGVAPAILGLPASEIRDQRPLLGDLRVVPGWLPDLLHNAGNAEARAEVLRKAVVGWFRPEMADRKVPAIVAGLNAGLGVGELAERVGLGERALYRRCQAAFGYGPKTTQRVLRFHRALTLARSGRAFAEAAAVTGYADQAHLAREVKALAGVSLGALTGRTGAA